MTANPTPPANGSSSSGNFTIVFLLVVILAGAFYIFAQKNVNDGNGVVKSAHSRGGLAVGNMAPEFNVDGWVDGKDPGDLSGKVVVVEAWATWCMPCREEAPNMVETWKKFANRDDVIFIGMTTEREESLPEIKAFLNEFKITWPNAYGGTKTLVAFQADYIPAAWVINKQGKVTWNFDSDQDLTEAILEALNQGNAK